LPGSSASPVLPPTAQDVHLARQPIYDAGNRCVAYELLYRASSVSTSAGGFSVDVMCNDTALHAVGRSASTDSPVARRRG
jgi:hypothetical protein